MKGQTASTWQLPTNFRHNPLKQMDKHQRRNVTRVLGWMWSMIFALSFLSIYAFEYAWIGNLLLIGGVLATFSILARAGARKKALAPVPNLSGASKCVWQMDREA